MGLLPNLSSHQAWRDWADRGGRPGDVCEGGGKTGKNEWEAILKGAQEKFQSEILHKQNAQ